MKGYGKGRSSRVDIFSTYKRHVTQHRKWYSVVGGGGGGYLILREFDALSYGENASYLATCVGRVDILDLCQTF